MRIRTKPWARPELAACDYFIQQPEERRGKWNNCFPCPSHALHLELGCGKGLFLSRLAKHTPEINYLAVDISLDILGVARRNVSSVFGTAPVDNLRLASFNIEYIHTVFAPEDRIDRIYIYFCNPWPKPRHQKRRLTHTRQLMQYREFLSSQGEIYFKTDDNGLFEDSLVYFQEAGFVITAMTKDYYDSEFCKNNIPTEHEEKFTQQGIPIKFLIAEKV